MSALPPNSDRKSGRLQNAMSAFPPRADDPSRVLGRVRHWPDGPNRNDFSEVWRREWNCKQNSLLVLMAPQQKLANKIKC